MRDVMSPEDRAAYDEKTAEYDAEFERVQAIYGRAIHVPSQVSMAAVIMRDQILERNVDHHLLWMVHMMYGAILGPLIVASAVSSADDMRAIGGG